MITLRHVHSSGRFDAPRADVATYLAALAADYSADLITTTEAQQRGIVGVVREALGPGWAVVRHREYLIAWRRTTIADRHPRTVLGRAVAQLSRVPGLPGWRNLYVGHHRLTIRNGDVPLVVEVAHTPSAVESGDRWRTDTHGHPTGQVKAYRSGVARWGRRVARRTVRQPHAVQVLAMDSNLNQHRPRWMRYLTRTLHATSMWATHPTRHSTHAGGRLIDTIHVATGRHVYASVVSAQVCDTPKPHSLDHTAVAATFHIRPVPPREQR